MFLILNGNYDKGVVSIKNNKVKVKDCFLTINSKISEQQLIIQNNNIIFEDKAEFIIDNNNPTLNIYVNMQNNEKPRNVILKDNQVELFVDLEHNLKYINKNNEIVLLKQGVVEE